MEPEIDALKALAKAARALAEDTGTASVNIDGRTYYHLTTFHLLEFAEALRKAEALVRDHG